MRIPAWFWAMCLAMALFAIGMIVWMSRAQAHSWYDLECCSGTDCRRVPAHAVRPAQGGWLMTKGEHWPAGKVRPSADGEWHECRPLGLSLLCVYGPMQGM